MYIHDKYPMHFWKAKRVGAVAGAHFWKVKRVGAVTTPFRLAECDHFFIAVPQPALPAHYMNCVCTYWFAELIRLAYFKSGPYSKVVLSWMQSHST